MNEEKRIGATNSMEIKKNNENLSTLWVTKQARRKKNP